MSDISPPLPIKRKPLTVNEARRDARFNDRKWKKLNRQKAREEARFNDQHAADKRRGWWAWMESLFPPPPGRTVEQELFDFFTDKPFEPPKDRSLRDQRHLYKQPDTR